MNKPDRPRPFKLGIRWINNPTKIFYFNFENMGRLKKVLHSSKWSGKYEWAAIYRNTILLEEFKMEKGWQRIQAG
ncbi:MAG: hypothetical protein KDC85_23120 [Saprospiraceae bacterium]|nr:hypothetical protein [Saprospiraceae bacterium]MCB9322869.1 hypothetical protein [Lewinellaceae bacterium]